MNISLKKVDEENTEVSCLITPAHGALSSTSILSGKLDEYLNFLAAEITGDDTQTKELEKTSGSNAVINFIIIIITIIALIWIFSR